MVVVYPVLKLCGAILDKQTSCMLPHGHAGRHAWGDPVGNLTIEWTDDLKERVTISWSMEDADR